MSRLLSWHELSENAVLAGVTTYLRAVIIGHG
jgi:hypothetical protein